MINSGERTSTGTHDELPTAAASGNPERTAAVGARASLGPQYARPALPRLSTARANVLRAVIADGGAMTVAALAQQLGQHPNTVREHLDALVEDERIERLRSNPTGRGRPAWLYRAIGDHGAGRGPLDPSGQIMTGPLGTDGQEYIALAVALIDQVSVSSPNPRSVARQAGERWGRALADQQLAMDATPRPDVEPVERVVEMLRELRFEPRDSGDPKMVRLTTCPFLDAAKRHPEVVCQVHLGIVRGAMERLGADPDSTDLTAFAEPGACLLRLPEVR